MKFEGKRALVLGVETAAGRALALALAEAGAAVAVVAAKDDPESAFSAKRVAGQIAKLGRPGPTQAIDAALATAVQVMVRQVAKGLGGLDLVVVCLDQPQAAATERLSEAEWAKLVGLNLSGLFFACRSAAREMARGGGGAILAVVPQTGEGAAYAALKVAALELVAGLARDLAGPAVCLNAMTFAGTELPAEGVPRALELLTGVNTGQVARLGD